MFKYFRFWCPYLFPVYQDDRQPSTGANEVLDLGNTAAGISFLPYLQSEI